MSSVKIAHVTTVDTSLRYLLLHQMHSFKQAGFEVLGISTPGPDVRAIEEVGIRHIPVTMTRNVTPTADLPALWRLCQVMRREKFTIVHTHTPKAGLLGQIAARMAGVPIVVNTVHGFHFHDLTRPAARRFYINLEKLAAHCSDLYLSQNREDLRTALSEGICAADKIRYLGNGIDLAEFNPASIPVEEARRYRERLGIALDAPVVGFVGRLAAKRKGFLDFLHAAQQVSKRVPGVRFLIVGEADHGKPDAIEPSVAAEFGIGDQCLFLGHRPNHELPRLYKLMDVLVLPSLFEGVPRVIMEASAMGVPAVATDVKGNREAVEHNRNGLLVPLGDVDALAAAIGRLLSDSGLAHSMQREGQLIARERFDEQLVFARVKGEYTRLLVAKGLPTSQPNLEAPSPSSLIGEGI